jgi:hypothetical protein
VQKQTTAPKVSIHDDQGPDHYILDIFFFLI